MPESAESPPAGHRVPGRSTSVHVPRACDACRARKIRCNRELPCAHCLDAKIECTHSGSRPKEKRTRILLTHEYERKIDHIDRRLDGIVELLEELRERLPASSKPPAESSVPATLTPNPSSVASPASNVGHTSTTGTVVEGASSLTAHSIFANDLLRKVVSSESRPEMRERVDALHRVVEAMKKQPASHEMTYPHAKPFRPVPLPGCDLPPIERTLEILRIAQTHRHFCIAWVFEFFNTCTGRFPESCLSVYLASNQNYDVATFITANAGLHYLFSAYAPLFPDKKEEYLADSRLCGANLETALCSLPLHLPANIEVVVALLLGAFHTIEIAKPSLAWVLSSKASELCQTLGYHRIASYTHDSPHDSQQKQFLFWAAYVLDKSLSLRLGRPSTIPDYDITIPYPSCDDPDREAIMAFCHLWVAASKIQGQIYELLYCPEAIAQPVSVRQSRVQLLVSRLDDLDILTREICSKYEHYMRELANDDMSEFFMISDHVLRLSTLTLIHRAVPNPVGSPTTFTAECIHAARETLVRHQECMTVIERSESGLFSIYMNWTILFAPFVPFIVLFCNIIETKDKEDLSRLRVFVASLHVDRDTTPVSEGVDKLRRLFQVLYNVASQYAESQTETYASETQRQQNFGVDTYLAALGFSFPGSSQPTSSQPQQQQSDSETLLPTATGSMGDANHHEFQRGVNPVIWMGNGAQLEDWFYSNQQMMEFLEENSAESYLTAAGAGWGPT